MLVAEHETFITELQTVAKVMRSRELDDQELAFYWDTLKDRPLADVLRRLRERSKRGKFMPKPSELRPREEEKPEQSTTADAMGEAAARANADAWQRLRQSDPVAFEVQYRIARASRMLVTLMPNDPARDAWRDEDYRWSRLRFAPRAEQEEAVRRAGPVHP